MSSSGQPFSTKSDFLFLLCTFFFMQIYLHKFTTPLWSLWIMGGRSGRLSHDLGYWDKIPAEIFWKLLYYGQFWDTVISGGVKLESREFIIFFTFKQWAVSSPIPYNNSVFIHQVIMSCLLIHKTMPAITSFKFLVFSHYWSCKHETLSKVTSLNCSNKCLNRHLKLQMLYFDLWLIHQEICTLKAMVSAMWPGDTSSSQK